LDVAVVAHTGSADREPFAWGGTSMLETSSDYPQQKSDTPIGWKGLLLKRNGKSFKVHLTIKFRAIPLALIRHPLQTPTKFTQ
jgi:hypothetical protein